MSRTASACSVKGWSHRQERASIIRDSQKASDEIRAARAALLARKDLERQQEQALTRVADARARLETFDPESHKLVLAEAVREAERVAAALQDATPNSSPPKKGK
jgi:septal ring factor EnvC (AmiA/AmiB activator)